jgi:hypothetical protein
VLTREGILQIVVQHADAHAKNGWIVQRFHRICCFATRREMISLTADFIHAVAITWLSRFRSALHDL